MFLDCRVQTPAACVARVHVAVCVRCMLFMEGTILSCAIALRARSRVTPCPPPSPLLSGRASPLSKLCPPPRKFFPKAVDPRALWAWWQTPQLGPPA